MAADAPSVAMVSRRVALEPLAARHIADLHRLATDDRAAELWPLLGTVPDVERFERDLWRKSDLQYVICRRDTGSVVGLVQALSRDARSRTVGLGLLLAPDHWRSGWPLEGIVLFLDLLFEGLGYRKVYVEMATPTVRLLGAATHTWLTPEVVLRRHTSRGDEQVDHHIFAIFRERWDPSFLAVIGAGTRDEWTTAKA